MYRRGAGWTEAAVYRLDALGADVPLHGPAIVESDSTTVWLPPGSAARLDGFGNLDIRPGG